jgi:hypothetical protein
VIRRDLIQFNEAFRELTLRRGSMKDRRRSTLQPATKDPQDAIEDLVAAQSNRFKKVRRSFPGLLPQDSRIKKNLERLLVGQATGQSQLDQFLQAVREATAEHFELARPVLGIRFQLCLGCLLATYEELYKKELRGLPVYAAYLVYLAVRRPKKLKELKQAMQQALEQELGMALDQ